MSTTAAALPVFGDSLSTNDPSSSAVVDNGASFNATWSTGALAIPPGETTTSVKWPTEADFWMHTVFAVGLPLNPVGSEVALIQYLLAGVVVAQVNATGFTALTFYLYTKQSGSLTLVGTSAAITTYPGILNTLDWRVKAGASGVGAMYSAGTPAFEATGLDNSGFAGIDQVKRFSFDSSIFHDATTFWSQSVYRGESTIGDFVYTMRIDSNGATQQWTGTYTDINELPTNDATFISSGTPGQVSTFLDTTLDLTGLSVLAVETSARMRVQGSGPTNLDLALRSGGTNYFASPITAGAGFQAAANSWTQNPNGSVSWVPAAAETTEPGAKSAA